MKDIAKIESSVGFIELKSKIDEAVSESKKILITDETQIETAGFYIKKFGELDKRIESMRKEAVKPLNDEVKRINSFFKNLQNGFLPEQERLKKESNEILFILRKRQAEEKAKEQKELEDAIIKEAEIFDDESILNNVPQIEFKKVKIAEENITTVRIKKWRVINIAKIPRDYFIVNEMQINAIRKEYDYEDKSPIEGIEFYYEENVRIK